MNFFFLTWISYEHELHVYSSPSFIKINRRIPAICIFTCRVEHGVNPDQLATYKPADLDRHRFQNRIYSSSSSYIKG